MAEPARATHGMIDYDLNSVDQIKNIEEHETLLREYAGKTQSLNEVPAIADFGCGPGLGSLRTVRPVLDVWRKAPPAQRVSACFVDLPGNDWSALRSRLFGQDGIVSKPNPPQIQLVARDFYKEIFPKTRSHYRLRFTRHTGSAGLKQLFRRALCGFMSCLRWPMRI